MRFFVGVEIHSLLSSFQSRYIRSVIVTSTGISESEKLEVCKAGLGLELEFNSLYVSVS